jgi:predicted MFS family arabinose efflux permease
MRDSLGWNYAQAGLLNTANGVGYLVGALSVGPLVARYGAGRVFRWSILLTATSLLATGLFTSYGALLLCRALAGLGGGVAYVGGASVLLQLDRSPHSSFPLGVYYGGPGLGIALSGAVVPLLLAMPLFGWRGAWVGLGLLGWALLLLVEVALRGQPAEARARAQQERLFDLRDYVLLWPTLLAYTLFGLGYIGYMTFVVAFLRAMQVAPDVVNLFWVFLGLCAATAGFVWGPLVRHASPRIALAAMFVALTLGALLPVLALSSWSFVLSALLFGPSFLAVVSAVTKQARQALPPARVPTVMGNATALFGAGQLVGPVLTGLVADMQGGLALGLMGSAGVLGLALLLVLLGPTPRTRF